jgi:hypothetical protein
MELLMGAFEDFSFYLFFCLFYLFMHIMYVSFVSVFDSGFSCLSVLHHSERMEL